MFTGLVSHRGKVVSILPQNNSVTYSIECKFTDLEPGESIAVNGACLTIAGIDRHGFTVDVSAETLQLTTLANVKLNASINLERALRLNDRLGGHWLTGHVDEKIIVKQRIEHGKYTEFIFSGVTKSVENLLVKKGSVAINGVSLTINQVDQDSFSVMCIPHTLQNTQLSQLKSGHFVNVEYDYLAKIASRQLSLSNRS